MKYTIVPYDSFGPLKFGMSEEQVIEKLGAPRGSARNRKAERVLQYDELQATVTSDIGLVEVGCTPPADVEIAGVSLFADGRALEKLVSLGENPIECLGFLVFLGLGVTMTGFHDQDSSQRAITGFVRGRWDQMISRMGQVRQ